MASTPTSPATDIEAHYGTLRALGPGLLLAWQAGNAKTPEQRESETLAINLMVQLRKNAPPRKSGGRNRDIMGVKARIDEVFQNEPAHDAWVASHWKNSQFRVELLRKAERRTNETPSKGLARKNVTPPNLDGITNATTTGIRVSPRKKKPLCVSALTATPPVPATAAALATEASICKLTYNAKFRLAHVIADAATLKLVILAGQMATKEQLDTKWSNARGLWSHLHEKFHDKTFNPDLESHLFGEYLSASQKHPDPKWPEKGYDIPEAKIKEHYKKMRQVRTNACQELPSGNNDSDWNEVYLRCVESIGQQDRKLLEVYYLIRLTLDEAQLLEQSFRRDEAQSEGITD